MRGITAFWIILSSPAIFHWTVLGPGQDIRGRFKTPGDDLGQRSRLAKLTADTEWLGIVWNKSDLAGAGGTVINLGMAKAGNHRNISGTDSYRTWIGC